MSSQFLQAWVVDTATFSGVLGSEDHTLVARVCRCALAGELRDEVESDSGVTLEQLFGSLVDGTADAVSWTTRRCMALVADTWGTRVDTGLTLPGRGWQALGPAWKHWGARAVATLWDTEPAWAKRDALAGTWPRIMWAPARGVSSVCAETASFDRAVVTAKGVPSSVPRFGEGEWPLDQLAEQVAAITAELEQVANAARRARKALILWLDGAQ